jgi:hypothetical protein
MKKVMLLLVLLFVSIVVLPIKSPVYYMNSYGILNSTISFLLSTYTEKENDARDAAIDAGILMGFSDPYHQDICHNNNGKSTETYFLHFHPGPSDRNIPKIAHSFYGESVLI